MNQKKYFYLAGIPRTGSTVLGEILNQNENIHVSPASPLSEIVSEILSKWRNNAVTIRAYKHPEQLPNVWRGVRDGIYRHRSEDYIIDKSWAWHMTEAINSARDILGEEMKVICTVDKITDCLASFIVLMRNNPDYNSFVDVELLNKNIKLTDENRCLLMMNPNIPTSLGWCHANLKKTYYGKNRKNIILIERKDLVNKPGEILDQLYEFLNCRNISTWGNNETHYFEDIKKEIVEDDAGAYGIPDLHRLGPKLRGRSWDARDILGPRLFYKYKNMEFWRSKKKKL